jgi:hypothetical protein
MARLAHCGRAFRDIGERQLQVEHLAGFDLSFGRRFSPAGTNDVARPDF